MRHHRIGRIADITRSVVAFCWCATTLRHANQPQGLVSTALLLPCWPIMEHAVSR